MKKPDEPKAGITMGPVPEPEPEEAPQLGSPKGDTIALMMYAKKKLSHYNKHRGASHRHVSIHGQAPCQDCHLLDAIERLESLLAPKPREPVSRIIQ